MTLYLENEENGNYKYVTASEPATFGAVLMNMTYGLNADGTVKDDEASQAFREMYTDIRFRQALMHAIDAEEVNDVVYHGLADVNEIFSADHDVDKANALLDEMGAIDIDGDGWRETPSGKPFQWQMWTQQVNDHLIFAELYNEYWHEIGLHCDVYVTESSLISTSIAANEVPMYIFYVNGPSNWLSFSWQFDTWAPLYNSWIAAVWRAMRFPICPSPRRTLRTSTTR